LREANGVADCLS